MLSACRLIVAPSALLLVAVSAAAVPQNDDPGKDVAAVRAVIDAQAAAWNSGDIPGYMEGYAKEDTTTFVSGDRITRGWRPVLERYKAGYATREKMGTLAFTDIEITPLGRDVMMAIGGWRLARQGDSPHGRFTLIFQRKGAGWRIVYDHTSSAQ